MRALAAALADVVRGAAGLDEYARYVAHHRRRHAGEPCPSRAEFFRNRQSARWHGVRRCC
ncbi:MAG: YbdD/YjiX family protein [Proteobacteria bacterium]|nr:YbdD/YjiX family protein [Pseudomonadota bacterium]